MLLHQQQVLEAFNAVPAGNRSVVRVRCCFVAYIALFVAINDTRRTASVSSPARTDLNKQNVAIGKGCAR
jgi:hypothetical protein